MEQEQSPSNALEWFQKNRLKAIFYTWASGVGGSLAYQWTRPIPTSLKLIHTRVYAQAITLAALGSVAAIELYHSSVVGGTPKRTDDDGF